MEPLKKYKRGNSITADELNKLVDAINQSRNIKVAPPLGITQTGFGTLINIPTLSPVYYYVLAGDGGTYTGTGGIVNPIGTFSGGATSATSDLTISGDTFTAKSGGLYWVNAMGSFGADTQGNGWLTSCTVQNPSLDIIQVWLALSTSGAAGTILGNNIVVGYFGTIGIDPVVDPNGGSDYVLKPDLGSGFGGGTSPTDLSVNALPPVPCFINTIVKLAPGDTFHFELRQAVVWIEPSRCRMGNKHCDI